jgi:hypothetical protein
MMQATEKRTDFATIDPAERILLLPHCLRHSDGCVDCEVDEEEAIRTIRLGCQLSSGTRRKRAG